MNKLMVFGIICEKKTKVSLLYATHTISINGFTSHVNIEAEYINENQHKTEAKFVFPVEEDSAVYKFEAKIGDVHLVAKSKDKDVAKKEYKEAVDKGQSAILLRETSTSGDIFEYSLVLHETETSCKNVKLNLCGKIGESDFSLDFEASLLGQNDKEMTIHRLCVKRKIQELELKEDLGKGDEIKSEIIDLGTMANLVSKYTSFVVLHETETSCENVKLNLCGKIGESDFSLDFEASLLGQNDKEMTIHRLCVKRKIQELELKEDLGKGDEIKSEIIDLGTMANLVSKYTSFVGLDEHVTECTLMPCFLQCSPVQSSPIVDGGNNLALEAQDMVYYSCCESSGPDFVDSSCLPQPFTKSCMTDEESFTSPGTTNKDILTCLVDLQTFSGFWNLDDQLAQALKISLKDLNNENPSVSDKIWATALVVAVLREKLASQHCEWELMEKKAIVWLESQNIQTMNSEKLLEKATNFIRNKMAA
uniref:VIT domain-containing protein n=1 Tax=Octopus bimaculoides TaxID=37653 RepID=A0A0L8GAJ2_OCTBM